MNENSVNEIKEAINELSRRLDLSHQAQAQVTSVAWGEIKDSLKHFEKENLAEWLKSLEDRVTSATALLEKHIDEEDEMIEAISKKQQEILEKLEPIHKVYRDGTGTLRILKWIGGLVVGMGATVAAIKGLYLK